MNSVPSPVIIARLTTYDAATHRTTFRFEGSVPPWLGASMRRVLMRLIEIVAPRASDVIVHDRDLMSPHHLVGDIEHRISQVPIHMTLDDIRGFEPDALTFEIREKGPKTVTSADIRVLDRNGGEMPTSFRDRLFPPHPFTGQYHVIAGLVNEQDRFHVTFTAVRSNEATDGAQFRCAYATSYDPDAQTMTIEPHGTLMASEILNLTFDSLKQLFANTRVEPVADMPIGSYVVVSDLAGIGAELIRHLVRSDSVSVGVSQVDGQDDGTQVQIRSKQVNGTVPTKQWIEQTVRTYANGCKLTVIGGDGADGGTEPTTTSTQQQPSDVIPTRLPPVVCFSCGAPFSNRRMPAHLNITDVSNPETLDWVEKAGFVRRCCRARLIGHAPIM